MPKYKPAALAGQVFGRLTVLRRSYFEEQPRESLWCCRCSCGNTTHVRGSNLTRGKVRSCGCLRREFFVQHFAEDKEAHLAASRLGGVRSGISKRQHRAEVD